MKTNLIGMAAAIALAGPAVAADIPVKAPVAVEAVVPWTGFYFGGSVGYHNIRASGYTATAADLPTSLSWSTICFLGGDCSPDHPGANGSGAVFGGHVGYIRQFSGVVLGIETDMQVSTASARHNRDVSAAITGALPFNTSVATDVNWFGTVRARAGMLLAPRHLAYVTGGFAYGQVERRWQQQYIGVLLAPGGATAGASTTIATGYAVGGGWDWAVTDHIRFGAEYLFVHLGGDETFGASGVPNGSGGSTADSNFTVRNGAVSNHIARVRLSIKP
jgi:outer membrane immunogenic protein